MGMYARLSHVSTEKLEAIRKSPTAFYKKNFGNPDGPDAVVAATKEFLGKDGVYKKMQAAMAAMPELQKADGDPAALLTAGRKLMEAVPELNQLGDVMRKARKASFGPSPTAPKRPKGAGLDKSWHCLHFVIAGHPTETSDSPASMAILGGTEIPDKTKAMGYGPVRYLTAEQVKAAADALAQFPIEERSRQFKQEQAEAVQVYCPNFAPQELQHYFQILNSYYQEAANRNYCMLLWIE